MPRFMVTTNLPAKLVRASMRLLNMLLFAVLAMACRSTQTVPQVVKEVTHDSLRMARTDTIPVVREVEVTRVEQHIPLWCKVLATAGGIGLLLFCMKLCSRISLPWIQMAQRAVGTRGKEE